MTQTLPRALTLVALLAALAPAGTDGQFRRGRAGPQAPAWAPVTLGVKAGYDQNANGEVLGAHAHLPVLRSGVLELMPTADVTFLTGAKEYQYGVDLVYVTGGRTGGLYVGGGVAYRHSVVGTSPGERDRLGAYSIVAGARTGVGGPFQIQLELRWVRIPDVTFRPTPVTLGVALPLWGRASAP